MRIIHLSYARITDYNDPETWLKRINFFVALVEQMAILAEVKSIHCINHSAVLKKNGVEYHFLKRTGFQLIFPIGLHQYIRRLNPEVIVVHGIHFPWQVLWLRWQLGSHVKIVMQHHAERPLRHYKKLLQKIVDQFVSAYFFTSFEQAKAWVTDEQIQSMEKVHEVMEVPSVFYTINKKEARVKTKS